MHCLVIESWVNQQYFVKVKVKLPLRNLGTKKSMVYKKQANWKMLQVNLRREIHLNKEDPTSLRKQKNSHFLGKQKNSHFLGKQKRLILRDV